MPSPRFARSPPGSASVFSTTSCASPPPPTRSSSTCARASAGTTRRCTARATCDARCASCALAGRGWPPYGTDRHVFGSLVDELLVACLSEAPPADLVARLAGISDEEWELLARLADWHGVAPLLLRRLQCLASTPAIPAGAAARLRDSHHRTAMRNMLWLRELARLLRELGCRGIDVIVLKGAYLASAVYGDPALRGMKDVDLLVRRRDLANAYRALLEIGSGASEIPDLEAGAEMECARHHHLPPVVMPNAGPVEMHWSITQPGEPVAIDMNGVWERASETRIAGARAMAMAPDDLLLHLSVHAALQHRFRMRLRHLCDIAVTLTRFRDRIDWDRLAVVANASGASRFVYCSLRVAESVLGAPVSPTGVNKLARKTADEAIIPIVREYFLAASLELPAAYRAARDAQGLVQKAGIVLKSIVPAPSRLRVIYGLPARARSVYLYYPVRLADLVARRGRVLVEMARGSARFRLTLRREEIATQIDRWVDRGEGGVRGEGRPPCICPD